MVRRVTNTTEGDGEMKLDRNINKNGRGKYALVLMRNVAAIEDAGEPTNRMEITPVDLAKPVIDLGNTEDTDFFVIRLKDKFAEPALRAYAKAAMAEDPEYGVEVMELAAKAALHPNKRMPD